MPEDDCKSIRETLIELERVAPGVPLLALGQTIFWDEPMKAGVAIALRKLGHKRRLVAGVHDTDYFAKLPSGKHEAGKYKAVPHNDTSTRGLWSAAGEFSKLFGSETVISREMLASAGLRVHALQEARPGILDEATEAWGWRGIVALDQHAPIVAEVPLRQVFKELLATFDWALDQSIECLAGQGKQFARKLADELRAELCEKSEQENIALGAYYESLLPKLYEFTANAPVDIDTTRTTTLLRFNTATCHQPRFEFLNVFIDQNSRKTACAAYNEAIRGEGQYGLARFGTGAIPFDLVIPGHGRGTIRLGSRGAVIMTPEPQFLSFRKPLRSVEDLAKLIEAKFGDGCAVVGKAVAMIGMLAREFVFVFHEGASSYVKSSRRLHQILAEQGYPFQMNPLLRIRYSAWDAMKVCCSWLVLPGPFQRAFGTEELCAPSFAGRWHQVDAEQEKLLQRLGQLRRPVDLIRFLDNTVGGSWSCLAEEYEALHRKIARLEKDLAEIRQQRNELYKQIHGLRVQRVAAEADKGRHFREHIFEKAPSPQDLAERDRLSSELDRTIHERSEAESRMRALRHRQNELVQDPEVQQIHERRRSIEVEAELKRLRLIRDAVISSRGLKHASHRPSAWWFPLVCSDGLWFRETIETAEAYLEPLI